jgi:hypothetical protein|tara:strand:- start:135 stop:515 length:381 start_codon:yes stop_codon:yes gene_type:complete
MQTQNIVVSFVAAEAITEFALVSINTDGKIVITDAGNDAACVGVAQRACSTGEVTDVLIHGITQVIASAALTFSNPLFAATTNGQVKASASTEFPVCRLIPNINQTASSGAGEQLTVLFTGPSVVK